MINVFVLDIAVTKEAVTDEERASVMRDVASTLEELSITEEKVIHITPREVYVMMVMLKEQQDALLQPLRTFDDIFYEWQYELPLRPPFAFTDDFDCLKCGACCIEAGYVPVYPDETIPAPQGLCGAGTKSIMLNIRCANWNGIVKVGVKP